MMKRVLSLLLCLVMALSFAAPVVQANGTDDIYVSDGSLSNVIVGDGVQLDGVVIDGETITTPTESPVTGLPIPGQMESQEQSPVYVQQETEAPAPVQELFPQGSDSETYTDGTTVSVDGIPENGELSIGEASEAVKEIVADYAAEMDSAAVELFSYDISVQDAQGEDWQPTGTVKMELEMPGTKLHKYSTVYVVHVDDNGVASTIEASVTEDGKIAFETPGFSTFAGFTVDFAYGEEKFSIKGLTEILVSQVMDTLKMPLYIEDVADVTFTDETLVSVTAVEGDWLLTSLQAFQTEEKLTLTMNDGTVYEIKVTDAITTKANFYAAYYNGTVLRYIDGYTAGGNAVVQLFLDSDGYPQSNDSAVEDMLYFDTQPLVIDGRGVSGCMEIVLQKATGAGNNLVWDLVELKITGGAKVVIRLGDSFTGTETITIKSVKPYTDKAARPMFNIEDGSLYFNLNATEAAQMCTGTGMQVSSNSSAKEIIIDGGNLSGGVDVPLFYTHRGIHETDRQNLAVRGVKMRNAKHRAVLVQTNELNNLYFSNCTFESTVREVQYGGGAIYIDGGSDGSTSNVVDVASFRLFNCTFSGNTGPGGHGGAIASYGDISRFEMDGCSFSNCTSSNRGGAIELSVNAKTATNNIYDWFKISNTSFTNCTAGSHGGAIDISNGDSRLNIASNFNFENVTFTNCKATNNRGGAIRMVVAGGKSLGFNNVDFSGCSSASPGGAVSVQGVIGNVSITNGSSFINNTSSGARGGGIAIKCDSVGNVTVSDSTFTNNTAGTLGGGIHIGISSGSSTITTVGAVSISNSTFSGNRALGGVGGAVSLTDGTFASVSVSNTNFTDNFSANFGGAIGMKVYMEGAQSTLPFSVTGAVTITDCNFTNCIAGGLAEEPYDHDNNAATANKTTWDHDGDPTTPEILRLNGTGGGGAIAIGGNIGGGITIKGTKKVSGTDTFGQSVEQYSTCFKDCYTWNNGGAVYFNADVVTKSVNFTWVTMEGCRARDAGNAFYLAGCIIDALKADTCTINNCSYFDADDTNFTIDLPSSYASLGTALYKAYDAGGTIRTVGNTTCAAELYNCTITNNKSYENGGGVYWNANNKRIGAGGSQVVPKLFIKFCNLDGNETIYNGGGLYVEAAVEVVTSWFANNVAGGRGGGIAQQIYNNSSRKLGANESTNLILNNQTIIHDNQANRGGGISITVSKTDSVDDGNNLIYPIEFSLGGAQVYDNKAITNGGGIYYATSYYPNDPLAQREVDNFQKKININNGKIYNNIAGYSNEAEGITSEGGSGGGVYMDSNQITTEDSLTDGTKTGYSLVSISSGSIYNNIAYSGNGGGIYLQGKNALCTLTGGTVGFYRDANNAIVKYPNKALPKVVDSTYSLGNGGGIAIYNGGRIEMTGGEICYNEAYVGGGIAVREGSSMLSDVDATTKTAALVDSNTATTAGGGIAIHGSSTMTMNGGTITNNTSAHGGAISIMSSGDPATIRPVDEDGKPITEDADGNPIVEKWGMIFNGGLIQYNLSTTLGGGICLSDNSTMQFNDGDVKNNWAATRTYEEVTKEDGSVVTEAVYTYKAGQEGGGIAVCQGSLMDIYGGLIQENASFQGGGIMVRGAAKLNMFPVTNTVNGVTSVVKVGTIKKNTATNGGGLGINENCKVNIEGGDILENTAGAGGGVWIVGNTTDAYGAYKTVLNINGGSISKNKANGTLASSGQGGGIYADCFCSVTVAGNDTTGEAGVISENTAYKGGGVYVCYGACLTLDDGHLINNRAEGTCSYASLLHENHGLRGVGGGVYVADGYSDANPATFTLTGVDIAIYGNIADYGADDVFASGKQTKLNVKQVKEMNLAGYEFSPEAWFEDYCINELNYTSGLNLASADSGITNGNVFRYRGATANHRIRISETNVTNKVNVANTFVCMTLGIPEAVPDTVVLDYGLPVVINIMDNDVILNVDELANTGKISSNGPNLENQEKIYEHNGIIYGAELDAQFMQGAAVNDQLVLTHGVATLNRTEGSVAYQMNSNDLIMDSHDTLWYAVYHKSPVVYEGKPEGYYYYGKVEAIPATTIYFEDSFGTAITYSAEGTAEWTDTTTPIDLTDLDYAQSQDRVGSLGDKDLDADNVYGFDPVYDSMGKYSFGSAKKVTVSETKDAQGNTVVNDASAVFTFKGTGFDIISHSNRKTGMVMVSVYDGAAVDSSKLLTTYMVDTWYQGNTGNSIYQIPAIKCDLTQVAKVKDNPKTEVDETVYCTYGTYTVKLYVAWTWWADHEQNGYGSWDYYLDGIRIYNPAGDGVLTDADGNVISTVIRDAYVADDEAWPRYEEVRNMLISANTFSNIKDSNIGGAIFIDGNISLDDSTSSGTTPDEDSPLHGKKPSVVDYANFGPNNELYLAAGQGVAFALDTGAASLPEGVEIASVQIGLRSTNNSAGVNVKIYDAKTTTFAAATGIDLNSSTDRYYDITGMDGGNVVIYCASAYTAVSITNVKITYTADPYATSSGSFGDGTGSEIPGVSQIFVMNKEVGESVLNSFASETETETETAPQLSLKYPSLSFEGEVNYNVYFDAQNLGSLTAADLGLAVFSTENTEGTVETADDVILGVEEKDGLYMATTNGIPAKNMGDRLYFKVFAKLADGSYVYSDMRSYNAVDYALDALNNSENMSLKALVVAMLNYGAAAQSFFGYNTNSLMNSALTAEHQNLISGFSADTLNGLTAIDAAKTGDFAATDGFAGKYPTVYFDGAFEINYNVIPGNAVDGVVTLYFWNEDTYAAVDTLTAQNADLAVPMVNDNGTWKACSQQIAAKDLDKTVYAAAVYESEGTAYCTGILTYSIAAYCQEQAADTTSNMSAFAQATAIYGSAAKVFFG